MCARRETPKTPTTVLCHRNHGGALREPSLHWGPDSYTHGREGPAFRLATRAPPRQERLGLREIREQAEASGYSVPATKLDLPTKHAEPLVRAQNPVEAPAEDTTKRSVRRDGLEPLPALDIAEHMPNIEGGIGAYYINIAYPEEAKILGIQGRLVLHFVVETDGTTSRIRVHKPLHPLCDSAAVQALRRTIFIPGTAKREPGSGTYEPAGIVPTH